MVNMGNVWDRTTEFLGENLGAIVPVALLAIFVPQSISGAIRLAGSGIDQGIGQGVTLALLLPVVWGQLAITALALDPTGGRRAAQSVATTTAHRRCAARPHPRRRPRAERPRQRPPISPR